MQNTEKRLTALLGVGMATDLATKAVTAGYTLSGLKSATNSDLSGDFSQTEIEQIRAATKRFPIPEQMILRLVEECDWKCCMCWNFRKESPVIIHHIEEHSRTHDDSYDNLVVLCMDHHAKAHSKWEISRSPYTAELVRARKKQWSVALAAFRAGLRPAPGNEPPPLADFLSTAPSPPAHFVGRRQHSIAVIAKILAGQHMAIQGMAGIGKTALAKQVAAEVASRLPGGIFWASMPDHDGNPGPILRHWLRFCAVDDPGDPAPESLSHLLRGVLTARLTENGPLLMVIDDVRTEWAEATKLLQAAIPRTVPLVLTTRDETLALALDTIPHRLEEMPEPEAFELLRAHAGLPVMDDEADSARALLNVIGFLPLAIELAGKRLAFLGRKPGFHLETLYRAVATRAAEALTLPGYPGLSATFSITYDALSAEEQSVFRRLGVFANGRIEIPCAAGIMEMDAATMERILDNFVARALLSWTDADATYRIHPLLGQYAQTLLAAERGGAERAEVGKRHMRFYLGLAEANAHENRAEHDRLEDALPNIISAVLFGKQAGENDAVSRFALALWPDSHFLPTRAHFGQAVNILSEAVIACRVLGNRKNEAIHLGHLGVAQAHLGHVAEALVSYEQALLISREIGDAYNECSYLGNIGIMHRDRGDIVLAVACYEEALSIALESHNADVLRDQLGNLGGANRGMGKSREAAAYYEKALAISRMRGDRLSEGNNLSNIGLVLMDAGDHQKAIENIQKALQISREIGDRKGEENRLGHLGNLHYRTGHLDQGLEYTKEALDISRQIGHRSNEGAWLGNMGVYYRLVGRIDRSVEHFEKALAISKEVCQPESRGLWLFNLATIYHDQGRLEKAQEYLIESRQIFRHIHSPHAELVEAYLNQRGTP